MGSPSSIIMLGFGNGTFAGSPSLVLTLGYGIGAAVSVTVKYPGSAIAERIGYSATCDRIGLSATAERGL